MAYTCPWHILILKDGNVIERVPGFKEAAEFAGCSKSAVYEYTNPRFNKRSNGLPKTAKGYEFIRIPATTPNLSWRTLLSMYKENYNESK